MLKSSDSAFSTSPIDLTQLYHVYNIKILEQEYDKECLKSSLRKFYGQYVDFIKQYEVPLSRISDDSM